MEGAVMIARILQWLGFKPVGYVSEQAFICDGRTGAGERALGLYMQACAEPDGADFTNRDHYRELIVALLHAANHHDLNVSDILDDAFMIWAAETRNPELNKDNGDE